MAETSVWRGTSSQWINFGRYTISVLLAGAIALIFAIMRSRGPEELRNFSAYILIALLVPIFMAWWRYLQTKNKIYELTNERLKTSQGVLNRVTDTLELYRVKDLKTQQPFLYRLAGVENIHLDTSDIETPVVLITAIRSRVGVADKIRNQVETIRAQKGVREIDVE